jgi:hypothetical protein
MGPVVVPDELEPELEPPDVAPVPEPVLETPVPEPTVPPLVPVLALALPLPLGEKPDPEPELAVASVFAVQPALKAQTTTHEILRAFMGGQYARLLNKCSSEARKSACGKPPPIGQLVCDRR